MADVAALLFERDALLSARISSLKRQLVKQKESAAALRRELEAAQFDSVAARGQLAAAAEGGSAAVAAGDRGGKQRAGEGATGGWGQGLGRSAP